MVKAKKTAAESTIDKRLTPDEFRAIVLLRGWTYRALAERWQHSEGWISKIANNPERLPHYDDAVRGLPQRTVDTGE
jgi:hypothetical protein